MENALTYIVLILVGFVVFGVYKLKNSKARPFLLSQQIYPELMLKILVKKEKSTTSHIHIEIYARQPIAIKEIMVELIMSDRQMHAFGLHEIFSFNEPPILLQPSQSQTYDCPFEVFKETLQAEMLPYKTFRMVLVSESGKKYKSNELAFNKKWVIYKPDSGTYN